MLQSLLAHSWPAWLGGLAIGMFVVLLAWVTGKALGVSSSYGTLCSMVSGLSYFREKPYSERWRLWFVVGIPLGGLLSTLLAGDAHVRDRVGLFETYFGESYAAKTALLFAGGLLVGYGSRWAGG